MAGDRSTLLTVGLNVWKYNVFNESMCYGVVAVKFKVVSISLGYLLISAKSEVFFVKVRGFRVDCCEVQGSFSKIFGYKNWFKFFLEVQGLFL